MDEETETFELKDFDQVVLDCATDKDCMTDYLLKRGATQAQVDSILKLREARENRDA